MPRTKGASIDNAPEATESLPRGRARAGGAGGYLTVTWSPAEVLAAVVAVPVKTKR